MNFVLRTFPRDGRGCTRNQIIGPWYNLVVQGKEDFPELFRHVFPEKSPDTNDVYAIICCAGQRIPVYRDDCAYIMTSDGETFEGLDTMVGRDAG